MLIAVFAALITSCSKMSDVNEKTTKSGIAIETSVQFHILDKNGNDLLGPASNNSKGKLYDYRNFKMYYLVNGKKLLVKDYDPGADAVLLFKDPKPYYVRVFTDCKIEDGEISSDTNGWVTGVSIAYLELNEFETDTIKTEWMSYRKSTDSPYTCFSNVKIWYNGELKPRVRKDDPFNTTFDVIK